MIIIEFISRTNQPAQIQVESIMRIDGKPYVPCDDVSAQLAYIQGRIDSHEQQLATLQGIASQRAELMPTELQHSLSDGE